MDKNGNPCVPPLGNGAKAAFEGSSESAPTQTENPAPAATAGLAAGTTADVPARQTSTPKADGLHSNMQNLSVSGAPDPNNTTTSTADDRRSTDTFESAKETLSVHEVPVVKTAEGPPAGAVVFDHPPSEAEQKHAEKLLQDVSGTA